MSDLSQGAIGTSPYADVNEYVPEQPVASIPRVYQRMAPSDARAIEIFLHPKHYNLITNPACRVDENGWAASAGVTMNVVSDSWVGQSLQPNKPGTISRVVYVGPSEPTLTGMDWYEPGRGGSEYTFSCFAKGSYGLVQMSMYGYEPLDAANGQYGPKAAPKAEVHSPFFLVADDWERKFVKTTSRLDDISGRIPQFSGCWWIRVEIEVTQEAGNQPDVLLSAFMLDPSEGPLCDYFDGSLDDHHERDDFLWLGSPDDSVSVYYPERLDRVTWLWRNIYLVAPANRPVAIYFHDRAHPWDPDTAPIQSYTAPSLRQIRERLARLTA
jgi:hypothetical protein